MTEKGEAMREDSVKAALNEKLAERKDSGSRELRGPLWRCDVQLGQRSCSSSGGNMWHLRLRPPEQLMNDSEFSSAIRAAEQAGILRRHMKMIEPAGPVSG
eukprot:s853_g3.t1